MKYREKMGNGQTNKKEKDWRSKRLDEDWIGETKKKRDSSKKSEEKRKSEDPELFKEKKKQRNAKYRKDEDEIDRLKKFQEAVMHGPMFICVSCHGKMFRCSVRVLNDKVIEQIERKMPIQDCIDLEVITTVVTEKRNINWPSSFKKDDL